MSPESDVARLREELDLSRRELVAARERLETALEEAASERALRERMEAELAALGGAPEGAAARPAVLGRLADRLRRQPS